MLRLAYLALTNTFALIRLLPMSDRDKDVEILALRHQMAVLQRTHRHRACCRGRCSQGASPTAFMGESSQGDPPDVGRLREVQAEGDIGGERCLEMLPCPPEPAGGGNRTGVGGVPGGEPGAREP